MYLLMLVVSLPWLVKASALCSDYMFDLGEYWPTTLYSTPTGEALCSTVVSQKSSNKICLKTELETATIPSLTSHLTCWIPECSFVERMGGESMQLFANGADPSNWKEGFKFWNAHLGAEAISPLRPKSFWACMCIRPPDACDVFKGVRH